MGNNLDRIVLFRPRAELDAETNLREFVRFARDELTTFGTDLQFDSDSWDVTDYLLNTGRKINRRKIWFTQFCMLPTNKAAPMREPFLSFAKGFIRYEQVLHPVNMYTRIAALRVFEAALAATGKPPNPIQCSPDTFNRAVGLLTSKYSHSAAYDIARVLERIVVFLMERRLVTVRFQWNSFLTPPPNMRGRVGEEFDQRRREKLPRWEVLNALADIYCLAKRPEDVIPIATLALLLSAPSRIGEVLVLPLQCEFQSHDRESGREIFGLRWWPEKGGHPFLKEVIPSMTELSKDALEKIRIVTEPARELARWYAEHPGQIYLSSEIGYLRQQEWLNMTEVALILGFKRSGAAYTWCRKRRIRMSIANRLSRVRFKDVELEVLKELPLGWPLIPGTKLHYHDALFVVRKNEFNPRASTSLVSFDRVKEHQISVQVQYRDQKKQPKSALIFRRHGMLNPDGTPMGLRSHQLRHFINTVGQKNGLSQIMLAKWSGRRDIRQNEAYDHLSPQELRDMLRKAVGNKSKSMGTLADLPKTLPILREEFAKLRVPTALTTDIGACAHDYVMETCQRHVNCLDCEDHFLIKNDQTRSSVAEMHKQTGSRLQTAEEAAANNYVGSNRWLEKHRATYSRLGEILSVLEDPSVPEGEPFYLPPVKG